MTHTKSNRALSFLLSLVLLLSLSSVFCFETAYAETEGVWQYNVVGSTAEITGYIGTDSAVVVPQKIANYVVTSISGLYSNNAKSRAVSITFPEGLKTIKANAFNGYVNLERVNLPESLNTIEANAFYGCTKLTGITLPGAVTSVGEYAFANCPNLQAANMTCSMTEIAPHIFSGDKRLSILTLPLYITSVGDFAFSECESLKSIVIPDGVKSIGASAFVGCSSLTSVTLPSEVKTIGAEAFCGCSSLTSVFVPNKTKSVGVGAFKNCTSLTTVYLSPSVTTINKDAFRGCWNLSKVVFGGDYTSLTGTIDVAANPVIYYPAKYASSWGSVKDFATQSYTGTTSISITGTTKLTPGEKSTLKIVINPSSGDFSKIYTITSSNTSVATVNTDAVVTAKGAGTATITVTDINGTVGTATITVAPAAPKNLTVSSKSTSSVELKWSDAKAAGYYIYRATSKNGTYKKVDTVTTTSYTDKGLTKGKTYYYKIKAYTNAAGGVITSDYSAVKSVQVTAPAPATVSATKSSKGVATVKWGKSTGANGYEVYMATSSSGKYTKVATITSVSTLSYKKTGLTTGKTYYFKVRSYITVNGKKIYSPFTKVVKVKV